MRWGLGDTGSALGKTKKATMVLLVLSLLALASPAEGRARGGYNRKPPRGGYKSNIAQMHAKAAKAASDGGGGGVRAGAAKRRDRDGRNPPKREGNANCVKVVMSRKLVAGVRPRKCICASADVCTGSICTTARSISKGSPLVRAGFDIAKCPDCQCVSPRDQGDQG